MSRCWKRIEEADSKYFVNECGEVKSSSKILTPRKTKSGYLRVGFKVGGKYVDRYIHRLVAQYFIVNEYNYPCVNHIDGNKSNNHIDNLEWCDYKMNMAHASTNNLINKESPKRKAQCKINQLKSLEAISKPMAEYDESGYLVAIHPSGTNALYRLTYKGHYYFDVEKLGNVSDYKNIQYIKNINNYCRHKYIATNTHGVSHVYNKIKDLPITREQLWYCFKHGCPDKNGMYWDIL